ncbi:hypothetical protein H072_11249 [Dactylellina haptotyla CBS 200.50]|uniref:F-box domain-containing protein n=1 Tax=Dactylellina haptotyla (strain CBS 200.50) TaxID=1284197 RepID=S8A2M0_DACHA|nr:hypothetical protein H072_11249 [Dactylellina haptotyla CBS 200.50]
MASLCSLPLELAHEVGRFIDDSDDFLALRMTCRRLNTKFFDDHLDSLYGYRRVFLVPESMENLVKISRHPSGVNSRVKELLISYSSPYFNLQPIDQAQDEPGMEENSEVVDERHFAISEEINHISREYETAPRNRYTRGDESILLTLAWSNLPNIRSLQIHFGRFEGPMRYYQCSRAEINYFFPSLGFAPGHRLPSDLLDGYYVSQPFFKGGDSGEWTSLVSPILFSGLSNLQEFTVFNQGKELSPLYMYQFQMGSQRQELFVTLFKNLTFLKLTLLYNVNFGGVGPHLEHPYSKFPLWLESIGGNLKSLDLDNDNETGRQEVLIFPTVKGLPRLKSLTLLGFNLHLENTIKFIARCKDGLEDLTLIRCTLPESSNWLPESSSWTELLRHICENGKNLKLDRFYLYIQSMKYDAQPWHPVFNGGLALGVDGGWQEVDALCKVHCEGGGECYFDLKSHLNTHGDWDDFWVVLLDRSGYLSDEHHS